MTKPADILCTGTMKPIGVEPALAGFFGVAPEDLSSLEVSCQFYIHNSWDYQRPRDQRITLTQINGIDLDYDVDYTNQCGRLDLWGTVNDEALSISILIGLNRFLITDIEPVESEDEDDTEDEEETQEPEEEIENLAYVDEAIVDEAIVA